VRAREPDEQGVIERDGVRVGYDVHGDGDPTVLLLPTWAILPARHWKAQVPFLARRFRVIVLEGRGNGRADRPTDAAAYRDEEFVADAVAVLDAVGV
jgi:pimeloyl-ACP methyl ester carboxylesterase